MHKLLSQLCDLVLGDIEAVTKAGKIAPNDYGVIGEAVDILKDIKTIKAMEEYGYESEEMPSRYRTSGRMMPYYDNYNSYDDGYSMGMNSTMRGRDTRTGRYMSRDDEITAKLNHMMADAKTENERMLISRMMDELR